MRDGKDAMVGVVCRTLRGGKPPSLLCIKALHASPIENEAMYRYEMSSLDSVLYSYCSLTIALWFIWICLLRHRNKN